MRYLAVALALCAYCVLGQNPPLDYTQSCDTAGCHKPVTQAKHLHPRVEARDCAGCHAVIDPVKHTIKTYDTPKVCLDCHKDLVESAENAPVRDCTVCHDPHGGNVKHTLRMPVPDLCVRCHPDVKASMTRDYYQHGTIGSDCVKCHDPHNRKAVDHSLRAELPNACLECHKDIKTKGEGLANDHKAVNIDDSCLNCHMGHSSNLQHLLRNDTKSLCLFCHKREIKRSDVLSVRSIGDELKENPNHHGAISEKNCSGCHANVHGGPGKLRLKENFPDSFYVDYKKDEYNLCFVCHERGLLDEKGSAWTEFRNGDVNLHYLHVNKDKKGRSCQACHEPHASKQESLIADTVPFGPQNWKMKLKFIPTKTGGSCQPSCHKAFSYDRDKKIINLDKGGNR